VASWVLNCAHCKQDLAKFAIEDTVENYFFPLKPDFPEGGKKFECPYCDHKATYQRTDLNYMPDDVVQI
jgi:DNA-directed RNA polymerase subunit RPC12/RpoP